MLKCNRVRPLIENTISMRIFQLDIRLLRTTVRLDFSLSVDLSADPASRHVAPLAKNGRIDLPNSRKRVRIKQIQLEQVRGSIVFDTIACGLTQQARTPQNLLSSQMA